MNYRRFITRLRQWNLLAQRNFVVEPILVEALVQAFVDVIIESGAVPPNGLTVREYIEAQLSTMTALTYDLDNVEFV